METLQSELIETIVKSAAFRSDAAPGTTHFKMRFEGSPLTTGTNPFCDEVVFVADGQRVEWHAGGLPKLRFTSALPVLQVCWCCFEAPQPTRCLCLLHLGELTIFGVDGEIFTVTLPKQPLRIWPIPVGILLANDCSQLHISLIHPLESLQTLGDLGNQDSLVYSSLEVPLVATYNKANKTLRIWHVEVTTAETNTSAAPTPATNSATAPSPLSNKKPSLRLPDGSLSPLTFKAQPDRDTSGSDLAAIIQPATATTRLSFTLLHAYAMTAEEGEPNQAHLVAGGDKSLMMCVYSPQAQRGTVVAVYGPEGRPTASRRVCAIEARSVCSVLATRPEGRCWPSGPKLYDLLVLHRNRNLALYSGEQLVCFVDVDICQPRCAAYCNFLDDVHFEGKKGTADVHKVAVKDPVGSRVTIVFNQHQEVRIDLALGYAGAVPKMVAEVLLDRGVDANGTKAVCRNIIIQGKRCGNARAQLQYLAKLTSQEPENVDGNSSVSELGRLNSAKSCSFPWMNPSEPAHSKQQGIAQPYNESHCHSCKSVDLLLAVLEDCKLDALGLSLLSDLEKVLAHLAGVPNPLLHASSSVPSLSAYLSNVLSVGQLAESSTDSAIQRSLDLLHYTDIMQNSSLDISSIAAKVAEHVANSGWSSADIDRLPTRLSVLLNQLLAQCGDSLEDMLGMSPPLAALVGRNDMQEKMLNSRNSSMDSASPATVDEMAQHTVPYSVSIISAAGYDNSVDPNSEIADDGMDNLDSPDTHLRFGRDLRVVEVRKLLTSSKPISLVPSSPNQIMDNLQQQAKLGLLVRRSLAMSIGRGALSLRTVEAVQAEQVDIPLLTLAGRVLEQNNAILNLDLASEQPAPGGGATCELTAWPEFHNGVAAGLKLAPPGLRLTRTWIMYNKPAEPSFAHAGLLYALGLTGHLGCLAATDVYRYLSEEHDATIVGILLGMSAAKRKTLDPMVNKMLFLHLPIRHPTSFPEIEISPLVQTAALLGVGLLYQESSNRMMVELLLEEISRKPGTASKGKGPAECGLHHGVTQDCEGYALAAGLALGLVLLGKGTTGRGLDDLNIDNRLRYLMLGGSDTGTVASQRGLAAASGFSLAPTALAGEELHGVNGILSDLRYLPSSRPGSSARASGAVAEELAAAQGSAQVVLEGELVNLNSTCPAATVALGLIYLQTNNVVMASMFKIPGTLASLDNSRPQHLQLRVLMRAMVMWEEIQPTKEWVQAQLPNFLLGSIGDLQKKYASRGYTGQAALQANCFLIAGACLAIGLKYAGTAMASAQSILHAYAKYFLQAKAVAPDPGSDDPGKVDKDVLESCLATVCLALSVVMAGTGHLPTFKLLRCLRKRLIPVAPGGPGQAAASAKGNLSYGAHTAIGMALGFLFLGGGKLTFGTSPEEVAALIIALYPRLPQSTHDQRYYLQALRHMYVLAAKSQSLHAIDIDSRQPCYIPVSLRLADDEIENEDMGSEFEVFDDVATVKDGVSGVYKGSMCDIKRIAPCLLPRRTRVAALSVNSPRYYKQIYRKQEDVADLYRDGILFVKCKAQALSYVVDPSGIKSLLSAIRGTRGITTVHNIPSIWSLFGADSLVKGLAEVVCPESYESAHAIEFSPCTPCFASSFIEYCQGVLYQCMFDGKSASLPTLISVYGDRKARWIGMLTDSLQTLPSLCLVAEDHGVTDSVAGSAVDAAESGAKYENIIVPALQKQYENFSFY